jgi:hypothetical protein
MVVLVFIVAHRLCRVASIYINVDLRPNTLLSVGKKQHTFVFKQLKIYVKITKNSLGLKGRVWIKIVLNASVKNKR